MAQLISVIVTTCSFVRLLRADVQRKIRVFATALLHLWHLESNRGLLSQNERRLYDIIGSDENRAQRGLHWMQAAAGIAMTAG